MEKIFLCASTEIDAVDIKNALRYLLKKNKAVSENGLVMEIIRARIQTKQPSFSEDTVNYHTNNTYKQYSQPIRVALSAALHRLLKSHRDDFKVERVQNDKWMVRQLAPLSSPASVTAPKKPRARVQAVGKTEYGGTIWRVQENPPKSKFPDFPTQRKKTHQLYTSAPVGGSPDGVPLRGSKPQPTRNEAGKPPPKTSVVFSNGNKYKAATTAPKSPHPVASPATPAPAPVKQSGNTMPATATTRAAKPRPKVCPHQMKQRAKRTELGRIGGVGEWGDHYYVKVSYTCTIPGCGLSWDEEERRET